jgi:pyruvate dehydrogenase E1 component
MNENYEHPAMPEGCAEGIVKGMYAFRKGAASNGPRVQLLGSGTIFREAIAAAELLRNDWGVEADLWSCPSFNLLARDGKACARWNLLHPNDTPRVPHVTACLADTRGPVIAATDYVRQFADQIRADVPRRYVVLGTDGFGRSDTRSKLREFFEVDAKSIAWTAAVALCDDGKLSREQLGDVAARWGIETGRPDPWTV